MARYNVLEQCLREGFIDYTVDADKRYVPKIVTNNKEKHKKVLDTILTQLYQCDTFLFSVAFITKSGIACIKDALVENKNVKGKILASQYLNFTEPMALREILKFPNVEIRMMTEERAFHAKGYLFHHTEDKPEDYTMVIGSSNMTANALTHNQEWNVFFTSAKEGALIRETREEFDALWQSAEPVTEDWISTYEQIYHVQHKRDQSTYIPFHKIQPNAMQQKALQGIQKLREQGQHRGLLISATGTGKTYVSAFDVHRYQPKRFLFVVHREMILRSAQKSYQNVGFSPTDMGRLTGHDKDIHKKYIFATIQTLANDEILHTFLPDTFDYIVMDEVHHGGAATYQKVLQYFKPNFLLGMTATPERTDGFDIYELFDHNIAYEIRLHDALEENMLVPFHYHGISEIMVNGTVLADKSSFNQLTCEARVQHILHYADVYGSDTDRVKGLVFCNAVDVAKSLADAFCSHGKRAVSLDGSASEQQRTDAVRRLEADAKTSPDYLDYIFTCDLFNEGIDIPQVNQIIMLRPTQSAIVFVQQLGRGLRKYPHKRYLEVLDFIGNYENNFLLPIALYGDRTYDKDFVRQLMHTNFLPGATSVYFDTIAKERIYQAIDAKKTLADLKDLKEAYYNMEYRLGKRPMMMDFVRLGDKDPYLFILQDKRSYYRFVQRVQPYDPILTKAHQAILTMTSLELANGKRIEDVLVLQTILQQPVVTTAEIVKQIQTKYGYIPTDETMRSVANVLTLQFFVKTAQEKYGNQPLIRYENHQYIRTDYVTALCRNTEFQQYMSDVLAYATYRFELLYIGHEHEEVRGFIRYAKYSRKDVSKLLHYETNREGTLNGYAIVGNTCPIFVTYHKREDISANTKYEDKFVSPQQFSWMTRARVKITSPQVVQIQNHQVRKLLFIKKSDSEGRDFYYLGDVTVLGRPVQTTIANDKGEEFPIVNFKFLLDKPVEDTLYTYLNS